MVEVDRFIDGPAFETGVWLSQEAVDAIQEYTKNQEFLGKLSYYARAGFRQHEGQGRPVKHEGSGVYRVGMDLFRLVGFYEDDTKKTFIGIACFGKHAQKLRANERDLIRSIAGIKASNGWRRKDPDGNRP